LSSPIFAVHSPISSPAEDSVDQQISVARASPTRHLSEAGKRRLLAKGGEPLFLATWDRALFIHYETDPSLLQRDIPVQLDLRDGHAFISIVAFTLLRMRPRIGGRLGEWLFKPIASHEFLNVRTYVRHNGEPSIFFLAEWLSNPLSVRLGPRAFGLPYRFGHLSYTHLHEAGEMFGSVTANEGQLEYRAAIRAIRFGPSESGSLTEFLLERYTAFTCQRRRGRLFRVWHQPWQQTPIEIEVTADELIASTGGWWKSSRCVGANYSPGVEVWMGRPHRSAS
jgi:uncharacterized protein